MHVHIVAAALPPQLDGIGDYTALLAAELAKVATVKVLTAQGQTPMPVPDVAIETVFSVEHPASVRRIADVVRADRPDWVLLQYNPFSYGRWGRNLHLPETMRRLRRVSPATRVAVMVHERYAPCSNWKSTAMATWQRWQFRRLARDADVMFFSVGGWADQARPWRRGRPTLHLPVCSNVPRVPITRVEARARLGVPEAAVVLGLFGTAHVSRMLGWVADAANAVRASGRDALALYIGPHGAAVRAALGATPLIADGPLPPEEISRRFAAMDIYLAPFIDGVSTRRTTLMTGLQHGVATVGTLGYHTDELLKDADGEAFLLSQVDGQRQFREDVLLLAGDETKRRKLGQEGQAFHDRHFTWENLTSRTLAALESFGVADAPAEELEKKA